MPKYEYKFVRVQMMNPDLDKSLEIGWVQEVPEMIRLHANNLGGQGWGLVAVSPIAHKPPPAGGGSTYALMSFKRELTAQESSQEAKPGTPKKPGVKGRSTRGS